MSEWKTLDELQKAAIAHEATTRLAELLMRTSLLHHAEVGDEKVVHVLMYDVPEGVKIAEKEYLALSREAKDRLLDEAMRFANGMVAHQAATMWRSCQLTGYNPGNLDPCHVVLAACEPMMTEADIEEEDR